MSAVPVEKVDVETSVEEPPVAVQATAPFLPAAEKEIVRDVTEKRLLHRFILLLFFHRDTSSQTVTSSLLARRCAGVLQMHEPADSTTLLSRAT